MYMHSSSLYCHSKKKKVILNGVYIVHILIVICFLLLASIRVIRAYMHGEGRAF